MIKFSANDFTILVTYLAKVSAEKQNVFAFKDDSHLNQRLQELRDICRTIGLEYSDRQIGRMIGIIENSEKDSAFDYTTLFDALETRIYDELSVRACMIINRNKADYYEKSNLFGDGVFNKFPSANFDIEESAKCFALARDTACVMHLQRVLEVGLKSYGNFLGIASLVNSVQPSWNRVLDETRKEIKERNDRAITAKNWTANEEKEFCEGVQPFLEAIKVAWRNPTMHVDKKYTEEETEDIFNSVKGLMRHLAKHLDESGVFTS